MIKILNNINITLGFNDGANNLPTFPYKFYISYVDTHTVDNPTLTNYILDREDLVYFKNKLERNMCKAKEKEIESINKKYEKYCK